MGRYLGLSDAWQVRLSCLLLLLLGGCEKPSEEEWSGPPPSQAMDAAPQASSPDRLPPGELLEGPDSVYGFAVPKGMMMTRHTPTSARIAGRVDFGALTTYVKDRIAVRHAEMLDGELLFPDARIRGNPNEIFRLTLREDPKGCVLVIRNETRPPATHGLTEKQRWERVGLRPDGGLVNPQQME